MLILLLAAAVSVLLVAAAVVLMLLVAAAVVSVLLVAAAAEVEAQTPVVAVVKVTPTGLQMELRYWIVPVGSISHCLIREHVTL